MFCEQLLPHVSLCTERPNEGQPQLIIHSWLSCPTCGHLNAVDGPTQILRATLPTTYTVSRLLLGREGKVVIPQPGEDIEPAEVMEFSMTRTVPKNCYDVGLMIGATISVLTSQRQCAHCGTPSGMPENDKNSLRKQLERDVTDEWLKQRVKKLAVHCSYIDRLGDERALREQNDAAAERALRQAERERVDHERQMVGLKPYHSPAS